jgi:hypothetical protein
MLNEAAVAPAVKKSVSDASDIIAPEVPRDEKEVLHIYRKAKQMGYADISISIQEGKRVKLWLTEKLK